MREVAVFPLLIAIGFAQGQLYPEQCQSLLNVPLCQPWGNCSGLQCLKASFVVFKCEDPVIVQLTLPNVLVTNFTVVNSIETVLLPNNSVLAASVQRDNNNLYFNASINNNVIVPDVVVPLNVSDCMCRSLQQISDGVQSTVPGLRCTAGPQCNNVRCLPQTLLPSLFGVDLTVLQCRSPPAVQISLTDSNGYAIYSGIFDRSQNATVSALLTLSVTIIQREYSMDIEVNISTPLYGTLNIFKRSTVILDKSSCYLPPPTTAPTTPTCRALQDLQSGLPTCYLNQACTGLNCAVLGLPYTVAFEVEPCTQPASILLTVRDATGSVIYSSSINDTTIVPLGSNISLYVVVRQLPNALGLKVDLLIPSGAINLVPFYTVPIDQSQCGFGSGSSPPSITPQVPNECEGFMTLLASNPLCMTDAACTGASCPIFGYTVGFRVLPCNIPPAIYLTVLDSNGTVLLAQVVDRTQQVPLVGGTALLVTLNQLMGAIGLEIDFQSSLGTINVVPYTVISFNTTSCGPTQATPSGTSPGTTCDALSGIATSQSACSTNPACDEIDCSVQGYTAAMALLPCNSPPAIRLTVNDSSGVTLYSQTLSQSRQVPLLGGAVTLLVTVDQLDGALGVQLDLTTLFGTGTIVPYTVVPINTSSCPRTQAPPTSPPETATTCGALSGIASSNPTCLTNEACDSLTCSALGLSTGFTVLPCNSPPAIAVSVNDSNGTLLYSQTLSQSQLVPLFGGALTLVITVDQLPSSLGLEVDAVSVFGGSVNIVPYTVIPLNTSYCGPTQVTPSTTPLPTTTCNALNTIPAAGQGCSVTSSCDEVDCTFLGYSTGFIVLPCNSPPAVGIIVNGTRNNTLFYQVISQSQQIPLFGVVTLDVTVMQLTNALGLKVDVIPLPGTRVNVIPYTVIPLNTSNCGPTGAPPTSSPPTTTCGALNTIAAANQACSPTTDCEEVDCSYLNYTIAVAVVPCSTPPGVKVTVSDPQGLPLYSQLLTQSQNVPVLGGFISLYVTVDQFNSSLGVKVDVSTPAGTATLIPYTLIPLNASNCVFTPTQAPPLPDTCNALRSIASAGQSCSATVACDGVDCQYINYRIMMRLLPCNTPPSIQLSVYELSTGRPLFNQTLSQSQQITVAPFTMIDVSITQLANAIGLKIDLVFPISRVNIIPYTVIPLNAGGCNSTYASPTSPPGTTTNTPSQGSTTPPKTTSTSPSKETSPPTTGAPPKDSQAQADATRRGVSIGVPVGVGSAVILLAIAGVVVFFALRRRRAVAKYSAMQDFSTNNDVYHLAATDDIKL